MIEPRKIYRYRKWYRFHIPILNMTAHSRMLLMKCQTSFVALNIEPEDDSEDEIDDSKEIQVGHMSDP